MNRTSYEEGAWFEPNISEALRRPPTYNQFEHEAFLLFMERASEVVLQNRSRRAAAHDMD
ncbi:hypothetical protein [Paenibacillus sp. PvR053]